MNHILVAAALIVLHNVDGDEIFINPEHITVLHATKEASKGTKNQLVTGGVNCVVVMSTGKFMSVLEDCAEVRKMMEKAK